jgi:hypothetical protein
MMKQRNKLILEFTEFNAQRLNPDSAGMSVHVDNPQLSINAFDRHEDAIRAGVARINTILHSLSNSSAYRSLKSKLALEEQKIQSMKILRIVHADSVNYDVYISFVIDGGEYYGVVENVLDRNPVFKSEVFKDHNLVQSKEWVIRTRGLVIKCVKGWLKVEPGEYRLLADSIQCCSVDTGRMVSIEKGAETTVVRSDDVRVLIKYKNEFYSLVKDNFVYFNYWFEKVM